jgi:hypothetical protein
MDRRTGRPSAAACVHDRVVDRTAVRVQWEGGWELGFGFMPSVLYSRMMRRKGRRLTRSTAGMGTACDRQTDRRTDGQTDGRTRRLADDRAFAEAAGCLASRKATRTSWRCCWRSQRSTSLRPARTAQPHCCWPRRSVCLPACCLSFCCGQQGRHNRAVAGRAGLSVCLHVVYPSAAASRDGRNRAVAGRADLSACLPACLPACRLSVWLWISPCAPIPLQSLLSIRLLRPAQGGHAGIVDRLLAAAADGGGINVDEASAALFLAAQVRLHACVSSIHLPRCSWPRRWSQRILSCCCCLSISRTSILSLPQRVHACNGHGRMRPSAS